MKTRQGNTRQGKVIQGKARRGKAIGTRQDKTKQDKTRHKTQDTRHKTRQTREKSWGVFSAEFRIGRQELRGLNRLAEKRLNPWAEFSKRFLGDIFCFSC
jgi:hypothetical protein